MKYISFHVLRMLPFSNPNRGKDNRPKEGEIGGVNRGRISSQSQNHQLRNYLRTVFPENCGIRTARLGELVSEEAKKISKLSQFADKIGLAVVRLFRTDENGKTQLLFLHPNDPRLIAVEVQKFQAEDINGFNQWLDPHAILEDKLEKIVSARFDDSDAEKIVSNGVSICDHLKNKEDAPAFDIISPSDAFLVFVVDHLANLAENSPADFKKLVGKKAKENKANRKSASDKMVKRLNGLNAKSQIWASSDLLDIALFGRMKNTEPEISDVIGAFTTAHAFTVNAMNSFVDFFTANDDCYKNGAGHMGDKELHSSLWYQYFMLNVGDLEKGFPLFKNKEKRGEVLKHLVNGVFNCIPQAMSRKTASAQCPPSVILIESISHGMPINYMNAFEKPCKPGLEGGLIEEASKRLSQHSAFYEKMIPECRRIWLSYEQCQCRIPGVIQVSTIEDAVSALVGGESR